MTAALKRGLAVGVLVLAVAALGLAAWGMSAFQRFQETPLSVTDGALHFEVESGDSVGRVVRRLERRGVTRWDWRWRALLWLDPATIQAGEYVLDVGETPAGLLERLQRGDVVQYRFTLVEGWNWWQLRNALQADERLRVDPDRLADDVVMAELGSEATHPEGWFLPETWAYTAGDDAFDVLGRAHAAMRTALDEAWALRDTRLPLADPYELLVLASIVEKESALPEERPDIAGVFVRRLEQNWRLETDPTVIYGIGETFDGDIRTRDLRADTPYNTYVHRGLPPTPIAMPSAAALRATALPAVGTAMFFVADGSGGHVFSDTLDEHNRAVQDLLRRQRAKPEGEDKGS